MDVVEEVESVIRVESPGIWPGIVPMEEEEEMEAVAVTEAVAAEGIVSAVEREDILPEIVPTLLMSNFIIA